MHGRDTEGISVVSRGGALLHAPAGRDPPGSAAAETPSIPTTCRSALQRDLCGRGYPPYPRAAFRHCQKSAKSAGRTLPSYSRLSWDFRSTYKRAASHMQVPFPHTFPWFPHPHAPARIPMVQPAPHTFPRLPHTTSQLPKSRHWFRRDQRFRPRQPGTCGSPRIPCADCRRGAACTGGAPTRRDQRPVSANHQPIPSRKFTEPATGLSGSTHQPNSLRFPAPARGAWAWRRFATRRRRRYDVPTSGGPAPV